MRFTKNRKKINTMKTREKEEFIAVTIYAINYMYAIYIFFNIKIHMTFFFPSLLLVVVVVVVSF